MDIYVIFLYRIVDNRYIRGASVECVISSSYLIYLGDDEGTRNKTSGPLQQQNSEKGLKGARKSWKERKNEAAESGNLASRSRPRLQGPFDYYLPLALDFSRHCVMLPRSGAQHAQHTIYYRLHQSLHRFLRGYYVYVCCIDQRI